MKQTYRRPLTFSQDIRTARHRAFLLHAQLVFVAQLRHRVFGDGHPGRPEEILRHVCPDFEVEPVGFNGKSNTVHSPVHFPPRAALTNALVNSLKGASSRRLRQEFPDLVQHD